MAVLIRSHDRRMIPAARPSDAQGVCALVVGRARLLVIDCQLRRRGAFGRRLAPAEAEAEREGTLLLDENLTEIDAVIADVAA